MSGSTRFHGGLLAFCVRVGALASLWAVTVVGAVTRRVGLARRDSLIGPILISLSSLNWRFVGGVGGCALLDLRLGLVLRLRRILELCLTSGFHGSLLMEPLLTLY